MTRRAVSSPLVFKIADDNGLLLLDWKDLQEMLKFVGTMRRSSGPSMATSPLPALARSRGLVAPTQGGISANPHWN
jgi:hypothetical protein